MKIQELKSLARQAIDIRREDLTTIGSGIRPTHVVGNDQQDVGSLVLRSRRRQIHQQPESDESGDEKWPGPQRSTGKPRGQSQLL